MWIVNRIVLLLISISLVKSSQSQDQQAKARIFFVSKTGNDLNTGSKEQPLATLWAAQQAVRELNNNTSNKKGAIIYIRGGEYYFSRSLTLAPEDSGTDQYPVVYKSFNSEKVVFSGGSRLKGSLFKKVIDDEVLDRLPVESRNKVYQIDLKQNKILNFGKRVQHGFGFAPAPAPLELFFNNEPLTVARWPNKGKLKIGKVIDAGSYPRGGDFSNRGATFGFNYERANRWKKADNIWLYGIFRHAYADDNLKVAKIDIEKKLITTLQPHVYSVASSDDTSDVSLAHSAPMRGFYVQNLLEEIDEPGEWFLDELSGMLYVWPPSDITRALIEVSISEHPFIEMEGSSNIEFSGIDFKCSRGLGMYMNNVKNIKVSNCRFYNLGTLAISMGKKVKKEPMSFYADGSPNFKNSIDSGSRSVIISRCKIYNTGTGGIILEGGYRPTLIPGGNRVENCEIYNFSRIDRTYSPAVRINGVGNVVKNCFIHDAPHQAIGFDGNNHLIEFNHFKSVCTDASDMGAIYTGRNPSARGTMIRFNFFDEVNGTTKGKNNGASMCGVYFDDGSGGMTVFGNVFYRTGNPGSYRFGAVFLHGGYDNKIENNLFIECRQAFGNTSWDWNKMKVHITAPLMMQRLTKEVDIYSDIYLKAYPELEGLIDTTTYKPRYNYTRNNVIYKTPVFSDGKSFLHAENLIVNDDIGIVDESRKNLALRPDSKVFKKLPDFLPIPFHQIGIQLLLNKENEEQ